MRGRPVMCTGCQTHGSHMPRFKACTPNTLTYLPRLGGLILFDFVLCGGRRNRVGVAQGSLLEVIGSPYTNVWVLLWHSQNQHSTWYPVSLVLGPWLESESRAWTMRLYWMSQLMFTPFPAITPMASFSYLLGLGFILLFRRWGANGRPPMSVQGSWALFPVILSQIVQNAPCEASGTQCRWPLESWVGVVMRVYNHSFTCILSSFPLPLL